MRRQDYPTGSRRVKGVDEVGELDIANGRRIGECVLETYQPHTSWDFRTDTRIAEHLSCGLETYLLFVPAEVREDGRYIILYQGAVSQVSLSLTHAIHDREPILRAGCKASASFYPAFNIQAAIDDDSPARGMSILCKCPSLTDSHWGGCSAASLSNASPSNF